MQGAANVDIVHIIDRARLVSVARMQRSWRGPCLTAGWRRIAAPASGLASVDDVGTSCSGSAVDISDVYSEADSDRSCTSGAAAGPQGDRTAAEDTALLYYRIVDCSVWYRIARFGSASTPPSSTSRPRLPARVFPASSGTASRQTRRHSAVVDVAPVSSLMLDQINTL